MDYKLYPSELLTLRITRRVLDRIQVYAEETGLNREEWCAQMIECCVADRRHRERLRAQLHPDHYTARDTEEVGDA